MIWLKANIALLVVSIVSAAVLVLWWWPRLPAEIPMHFDQNMVPDNVVSAAEFVWTYLLIQLGCLVVFVGLAVGVRYLPVSLINLPHREYWLSGERRTETLNWISGMLLLIASAELWLVMGLCQMSVQYALGNVSDLGPSLWVMIGLFLALCAGLVIYLLFRFRKPV
ncbi:MAG: DUF1648 domain-containing protein [Mariniblastus sp.]|nr:DUF1648 domain-containing protein [Mariniblastus sp.]